MQRTWLRQACRRDIPKCQGIASCAAIAPSQLRKIRLAARVLLVQIDQHRGDSLPLHPEFALEGGDARIDEIVVLVVCFAWPVAQDHHVFLILERLCDELRNAPTGKHAHDVRVGEPESGVRVRAHCVHARLA